MSYDRAMRMTGKRASEFREKDNFYPTPPEGTRALLEVEKFYGPIWEPACGAGDMSRELIAAGYDVISTDLVDRGYGENRVDSLMEFRSRAPNIVTNPPFTMAHKFAAHALALAERKVCMLARIQFLEGRRRKDWWKSTPLKTVWVFSWRLPIAKSEVRPEAERKGSVATYAWYVWDKSYTGRPEVNWI